MNRKTKNNGLSRRDFIKTTAAMSAAMAVSSKVFAAGSEKFKIALIGCGGRGNGALDNCYEAAKVLGIEVKLVATADAFRDRAVNAGKKYGLAEDMCFSGFDAYRKLLDTDPDIVLMATSPNFRPLHLESSIKAGKHVFMEKPVAVDPPGARRVIAAGELAKQKGLGIVAGTQRRHEAKYQRTQYAISKGAIGDIRGGAVWWCGGRLWYKEQQPGESDADYMVRNWVSFTEMSGDHIIEQHVHNLDVANWFLGRPPVSAFGFGGRARRKTGNQFDFFSIDLDYGEGCHIHSSCRQVNGCYNRVSEFFSGAAGTSWGGGPPESNKAMDIEVPDFPERNPYVQEHVDLMQSIIDGKVLNEARNVAEATMTAIMSRISAYTGQLVRWSDVMTTEDSPYYNLTLKPTAEDFEAGPVTAPEDDVVAIPGKD
jgi:myo-inositol 2-dehydrogenase/D-chiro-inositol 1-dehydrogenase